MYKSIPVFSSLAHQRLRNVVILRLSLAVKYSVMPAPESGGNTISPGRLAPSLPGWLAGNVVDWLVWLAEGWLNDWTGGSLEVWTKDRLIG